MRVVLETNVVVSGLLTPGGACGQILDLVVDGVVQACVDGRIVAEYEEVLERAELGIDEQQSRVVLEAILRGAEWTAAKPLSAELPDPDDLAFLEVAGASRVVLVSGNIRHFPAPARGRVVVLTPREFLGLLRHASSAS